MSIRSEFNRESSVDTDFNRQREKMLFSCAHDKKRHSTNALWSAFQGKDASYPGALTAPSETWQPHASLTIKRLHDARMCSARIGLMEPGLAGDALQQTMQAMQCKQITGWTDSIQQFSIAHA